MNNFNQYKPTPNNFKISIGEAFLYLLLIIAVGQIIGAIILAPTFFLPELNNILLPLSFLIGFGMAVFLLLKIKGMGISDIKGFMSYKINPIHIGLAIALYITALPIAEFSSSLIPTEGVKFLEDLYKSFESTMKIIFKYKIAAFITICILAPILEEFIFRGIILRGMLQKGVKPCIAIILSGFLFGLAHMNPWQFMGAGFLGIIFGIVYWRTKALWLVMFLHFLNNFIAYVVTIKNNSLEESVFEPNFILISISALISIIIAYFLIKNTNKEIIRKI